MATNPIQYTVPLVGGPRDGDRERVRNFHSGVLATRSPIELLCVDVPLKTQLTVTYYYVLQVFLCNNNERLLIAVHGAVPPSRLTLEKEMVLTYGNLDDPSIFVRVLDGLTI